MFADQADGGVELTEDLSAEQAQAAVTQDGDEGSTLDGQLAEDLEGGGQGFGEDGLVVVNVGGDFQEIADGKGEIVGEAAVAAGDAQDGAAATVFHEAFAAHVAFAADAVDGADDAFAEPGLIAAGTEGFDAADEFVTEDAGEEHVAFNQFQVGSADAHAQGADERFAGSRFRLRIVFDQAEASVFEDQRTHERFSVWGRKRLEIRRG